MVLYARTMFVPGFSYSVQAKFIFSNIMPDFSQTVQANIDVLVLYARTMFVPDLSYLVQAKFIFTYIMSNFSVQANIEVIVH